MAPVGSAWPALLALLVGGCYTPRAVPSRAIAIWEATPREASEAGPVALTAARAGELAAQRNPTVAALRNEARALDASVGAASRPQNPELRIDQLRIDEIRDSKTQLGIGLRMRADRPGTLDAQAHAVAMSAEEAWAEASAAAWEAAALARGLHARVSALDALLAQTDREIEVRTARSKHVEAGVEAAVATRMDLAMTRLEVAGAIDDRAALLNERDEAMAELRQLLALPVGTEVSVVTAPDALLPMDLDTDDAALVRAALEARPELRARAARVAEAEAEVYIEKAERWPWLTFVQVGYELDTDPEPDPAAFSFGLGIELPLFSWNTDGIAMAEAEVERRQADEEATVREVAAAVEASAARVRSTARRLATMREVLLPAAEESALMIEQALAAGAVDPLQTTVIEEQRLRAQKRYLEALREHREAIAELELAIGAPLPARGPAGALP